MPDVSVIIPTRDRSGLLAESLRSALSQRNVDLEVVIIDDGSSDGTPAAIARLADPRVKLVCNARPEGVSAARNRGIAEASGEWIAFLDDDDLWAPRKLSSQLAAARAVDRAWAYGGAIAVNDELDVLAGVPPPPPQRIVEELPYRNIVPAGASNVLARKDLLAKAGPFDARLRHMSDWDLWIRLARLGLPAAVEDPVVAYRVHAANASNDTWEIPREIEVIERRYADLRGGRRCDRAFIYRWTAWSCLRKGDRPGALRAYMRGAASGDLLCLGRIAVGMVYPGVARRKLRRHLSDATSAAAAEWLRRAAGDSPCGP